jgi:dual specificity tyrosine-phosphorylation-regulated kinase 2/3/4
LEYTTIYYLGHTITKPRPGKSSSDNYGFDDDRGDYRIVTGDQIAYRYEVISLIGKGSFGHVVKCTDHKTGEAIALKIIRNKSRFHQ